MPVESREDTGRFAPQATRLLWSLRAIVALGGLIQSYFWRNQMDADGMSYVDAAKNYAAGNFEAAITGYWSPLYSWIVALVFKVFNPSARHEFALVQTVDFAGFLVAIVAFDFLLRTLVRRVTSDTDGEPRDVRAALIIGYAVFGYGCIAMNNVGRGGPDFLLAAAFYAAMALLVRITEAQHGRVAQALFLGVILGGGYLAKAVMLPMGLAVILCATLLWWRTPRGILAIGVLIIGAGVTSIPWIVALSNAKGRVTTGDTARLNYAWYVNDAPIYHWQGDPLNGTAKHPTRILSTDPHPRIFEFATPLRGTYPVWYDDSYWTEGLKSRFNARAQVRRWSVNLETLLTDPWFAPVLLMALALGIVTGREDLKRATRRIWYVFACSAAGIALYFNVLILPRHITPFVVAGLTALGVAVIASTRSNDKQFARAVKSISHAFAITLAVLSIAVLIFVDRRRALVIQPIQVADQLAAAGLGRGVPVGVIGDSMHAYWAHLGTNRIVAEIQPEEASAFWAGTPDKRLEWLNRFASTTAVAVVADQVPGWADTSGWTALGKSGYFYYSLQKPASETP